MSEPVYWSAVNLSEGRDHDALAGLVARLGQSSSASLKDWSADADHNRAVFSLLGTESELRHSYCTLFAWAESHLDLSRHTGVHPRIGAIDVVPLCPLRAEEMALAAAASRRCAERVSTKFELPVFCYRESSRDPHRPVTLPQLRRGGPEALARALAGGELCPDFGPAALHPRLGAAVFGARPPLVAFNCLLDTQDLLGGQAVARAVREVNGGPMGLQALAFVLPSRGGLVQLSMNLLRPARTDVECAFFAVAQAARSQGFNAVECEVIGLLPESHLPGLRRLPVPCPASRERQLLAIDLEGFEAYS